MYMPRLTLVLLVVLSLTAYVAGRFWYNRLKPMQDLPLMVRQELVDRSIEFENLSASERADIMALDKVLEPGSIKSKLAAEYVELLMQFPQETRAKIRQAKNSEERFELFKQGMEKLEKQRLDTKNQINQIAERTRQRRWLSLAWLAGRLPEQQKEFLTKLRQRPSDEDVAPFYLFAAVARYRPQDLANFLDFAATRHVISDEFPPNFETTRFFPYQLSRR